MFAPLALSLALAVPAQTTAREPVPTLAEVRQGLEDIDRALRGYTVELEVASKRAVMPPEKRAYVDQSAAVLYKSDRTGRVFCQGRLTTAQSDGTPLTIHERAVFNGEVVKRAQGVKTLDAGRITKNRGEVFFQGLDPRHFLSHVEFAPVGEYLTRFDGKVVGWDSWAGRKVVLAQIKTTLTDGQEFTRRFYLDPERSFGIAKVATCYRNPPAADWIEFERTEVKEAVRDACGVWLPTRVVHEEFPVSTRPDPSPQLMLRSEIVLKNWVANPDLPDATFSLDFQPGAIVRDEVNGNTIKAARIDDQMVADQSNMAARGLAATSGAGRGRLFYAGLGVLVVAAACVVYWAVGRVRKPSPEGPQP